MPHPDKRLKTPVSSEQATVLALRALEFLVADEERLAGLMAATGLNHQDLRSNASDPAFLGGILDYLLSSEPLVIDWARTVALPPEMVAQVRRYLPGGSDAA